MNGLEGTVWTRKSTSEAMLALENLLLPSMLFHRLRRCVIAERHCIAGIFRAMAGATKHDYLTDYESYMVSMPTYSAITSCTAQRVLVDLGV